MAAVLLTPPKKRIIFRDCIGWCEMALEDYEVLKIKLNIAIRGNTTQLVCAIVCVKMG